MDVVALIKRQIAEVSEFANLLAPRVLVAKRTALESLHIRQTVDLLVRGRVAVGVALEFVAAFDAAHLDVDKVVEQLAGRDFDNLAILSEPPQSIRMSKKTKKQTKI